MKTNTIKNNFPSGWIPVKVGDIGSTYSGLRSKNKHDFGHGSPFITYMNIFSNSKIDKNRFDLVNVGVDENQSKVKYGDVFFTVSSETPEEVGMSSVLLDEVDDYYLNSFCFGFRLNDFDSLTPQYARYLFRGSNFRSKIVKMAQGSTRFNLSKERVLSLDITLPPIKEQQKIAEILGTVDENIAKTQEVIKAIEKLKRGLMQQLFTRGIGHAKFKKTKIGSIPEEWDVEKIGKHAIHVGSGTTPRGGSKVYLTEGVPFIRSQNVYFEGLIQDNLVYINEQTNKEMSRSKTLPNDVLLNITGASLGRACVVPADLQVANVNQHVCIIRPSKGLLNKYLFYFLQSKIGQNQIFKFQIGGNREGLNFQQIRSIEIPFPKDVDEQQKIAEILSAVDEKISVNKKLKEKLTLLKKGLMQDLLSGVVRINI